MAPPDPEITKYRVGSKLRTTIYRVGDFQPCAWVPDDPELADRIVRLLNQNPAPVPNRT